MPRVRTRITVAGFTEAEAREGIPHLLHEFQQRPWLVAYEAKWDATSSKLVISVETEGDHPKSREAHSDEVWDCVIACVKWQSALDFEIEDSRVVDSASQ
jgi:hypothetical protein